MTNENNIIDTVEREVSRPISSAHQAAALAGRLFQLREIAGISPDRFERLVGEYFARVHSAGLDDLLVRQLTYATTLASAPGDLIYEELHKLLSLCDEVFSLQSLGFSAPDALSINFEREVRTRLSQQRGAARMAAEDRVEEWKKDRWWYSVLLSRDL